MENVAFDLHSSTPFHVTSTTPFQCNNDRVIDNWGNTPRKRMGSGDPPGLQNRRAAPLVSPVRSTRTRFRQFVFREMRRCVAAMHVEKAMAKTCMCDKKRRLLLGLSSESIVAQARNVSLSEESRPKGDRLATA